jgi:hypothetical protein
VVKTRCRDLTHLARLRDIRVVSVEDAALGLPATDTTLRKPRIRFSILVTRCSHSVVRQGNLQENMVTLKNPACWYCLVVASEGRFHYSQTIIRIATTQCDASVLSTWDSPFHNVGTSHHSPRERQRQMPHPADVMLSAIHLLAVCRVLVVLAFLRGPWMSARSCLLNCSVPPLNAPTLGAPILRILFISPPPLVFTAFSRITPLSLASCLRLSSRCCALVLMPLRWDIGIFAWVRTDDFAPTDCKRRSFAL